MDTPETCPSELEAGEGATWRGRDVFAKDSGGVFNSKDGAKARTSTEDIGVMVGAVREFNGRG